MRRQISRRKDLSGFSLLEVLVAMMVTIIGLVGMAGLQAVATRANLESYQRAQALILLQDMVDRINANRKNSGDYDLRGGTLGTSSSTSCGPSAVADCNAWSAELLGAGETQGTSKVGAIIEARGCVDYASGTEVAGAAGTGIYTVAVAWRGADKGFVPSNKCGEGAYGDETLRRAVSYSFRIAFLQ
jgi:type IV pilus assembly protein PilV